MDLHYPTIDEPATPEYVLAVLLDQYRLQFWGSGPVKVPLLTFDSSVDELFEFCEIAPRDMSRYLNSLFRMEAQVEDWLALLRFAKRRTLRELCDFIAVRGKAPKIRPAQLLGVECLPAGVFLTIRSLLNEAGVKVDQLAPSTPLEPYLKKHADLFLGRIASLAPGTIPPLQILAPAHGRASLGVGFGLLTMGLGSWLMLPEVVVSGLIAIGVWGLAYLFLAERIRPRRFFLGHLVTFRDLSLAIARQCCPASVS